MNRIGPIFVLAALLLAGCDGGKKDSADASKTSPQAAANTAAPIPDEVRGPVTFQPGEWTNTFEFTNFYAPGIKDKAAADHIRQRFEQIITSYKNRCMSPEEAVHPSAGIFTDAADSGTCTYDHFLMRDGRIEAKLACIRDDRKPGPAMIVEGSYTPTSFDMRTITQMPNFASPGSPALMVTAHVKAHRIGPCGK